MLAPYILHTNYNKVKIMNENIIKIIIIVFPIVLFMPIIYFIATSSRKKEMTKIIKYTKDIISSNEDDLREISTKTANISKDGIEITARAIKDGLIKEKNFCKHCGVSIDSDSKFCNNCGKEQ